MRLRGDSTTSLVWSTEESFKAGPSENAAAAFLVLGQVSQNFVESGDHLKGIWNMKCDRLSRGETPEDLGYETRVIRRVEDSAPLTRLLQLCNPKTRYESKEELDCSGEI